MDRRAARERALELLYESDAKRVAPAAIVDELPVRPDEYAVEVACGVSDDRDDIDARIGAHAHGWTLQRMPLVDLTVLRMATFELLRRPDVPVGVVISEAVDLAKQFSTDDSGRFVNGVLSAIAREARPDG